MIKGRFIKRLPFNIYKAFVLSQENGKIIDTFGYGPVDTDDILNGIKKRFNISCPEGATECDLDFLSSKLSYNSKKRLLASGDGHSQRVRIIDIDSPHKMILELNSDINPRIPKGGM